MPIHKNIPAVALLVFSTSVSLAADYHIRPGGDDLGTGSRTQPIASFARAAELLEPGDTLHLMPGRYREPISWKAFGGTAEKPIRIVGESGAVLDGTRPIDADWKQGTDGVWSARIDFDVWQLFHGDKLVYLARWPDASFEDGSMWRMTQSMRAADGGFDRKKGQYFGKGKEGLIYDRAFSSGVGQGFHEGDSRYEVKAGQPSLSQSGKDFSGAVAVLNIGHWLTWARPITEHSPGADHFSYEHTKIKGLNRFYAWYILGLAALDSPNEWWFDAKTKTVYYMPPVGQDPNQMDLFGKVRDFAVDLNDCAHLSLENVTLFGAGFFLQDSEGISFEDCRFLYSATHKFGLGRFDWVQFHNPRNNPNKMPSVWGGRDNAFINCEFAYCNAPIYLGGTDTRIENCLFHDIEWDLNSNGAAGSILIGRGGTFLRNTVFRTGNSEGVRPLDTHTLTRLNRIYDMGNLQHDGAAINVSTSNHLGSSVDHNWAHDSNRQGVRFDYHGGWDGQIILRKDGQIHGDGVYTNNVTWNTQPNQVKGDRHLILNNTVINVNRYADPAGEEMTMSVQGFKCMHDIDGNANSVTRNNLANLTHRSWNFQGTKPESAYTLPGVADHNMKERGAAYQYLRDPLNYDFRPRQDSPLVDAGKTVAADEIKSLDARFDRIEFVGNAPDIGAYEHGDPRYWIPGRQQPTASTPIPKNGGTNVPLNADLMFLEAYKTEHHQVYFGTSQDRLTLIADLTNDKINIVTPPTLTSDTIYYWRVDAADTDGNTKPSAVWSFTTGTP